MTSLLKRLLLLTLPSLVSCFVFGEVFFRFVIPSSQMPWGYYDGSEQIAQFERGQGSGVYTIGRFAGQRGRWRINNMGWNSDIDYLPAGQRSKPLIAVVGDSYIEALQVDVTASVVSVLRRKVGDQYDVYGFGKSGAPLSQYLQMSRYVNRVFKPDVIVVNVVHNDFDESLTSVKHFPYFLGIDIDSGRPRESRLARDSIRAKTSTKIFFASATARYLWQNLDLGGKVIERIEPRMTREAQAARAARPGVPDASTDIYKAADYVMTQFVRENPGKELIFMIDAPRKDIYAGTIAESEVLWMNQLLRQLCLRAGSRFIDLTEPFNSKYQQDHQMLSGSQDYHWNTEGHRYAGEVLYQNLVAFGIVHPTNP
jgi:hypothetical protein